MSNYFDPKTHDLTNPSPWMALALDQSTFFDQAAKEALLKNNSSWSRQAILPFLRPFCRLGIALLHPLRVILPKSFSCPKTLHAIICFGMRRFILPEANYLIFRHFHIGSQILQFLGNNIGGLKLTSHPLLPKTIDDFYPNTFIQHDLNIYNFIIQVNAQLRDQGRNIEYKRPESIDFSAIQDFDHLIQLPPKRWYQFLDLQSAIELYTPLFALFLSDDDFWRSSNSLQLDETIAAYIAQLFGYPALIGLVNNKHPMVPLSTLQAGFRLMLHGLDAENLYGFIKRKRDNKALP